MASEGVGYLGLAGSQMAFYFELALVGWIELKLTQPRESEVLCTGNALVRWLKLRWPKPGGLWWFMEGWRDFGRRHVTSVYRLGSPQVLRPVS